MTMLKTTRLTKNGERYEIEIPPECIEKLGRCSKSNHLINY